MKYVLSIAVIFCWLNQLKSQNLKIDTLTNDKIVSMVRSGITDLLIRKSVISAQYWYFDLTPDGIINLKKNKVSDSIIVSMFDKAQNIQQQKSIENLEQDGDAKILPTKSESKALNELQAGVYFEQKQKNTIEYLRLNVARPAPGFRSDPIGLTMRTEYAFLGKSALLKIKTSNPEFYLVVGNGYDNILYQPTQFIVIHAEEKKGNRIIDGKAGVGLGMTRNLTQFDPKDIITPIFTRINNQLYKVSFEKKLPKGNYFFGPPNASASTQFLEFDID